MYTTSRHMRKSQPRRDKREQLDLKDNSDIISVVGDTQGNKIGFSYNKCIDEIEGRLERTDSLSIYFSYVIINFNSLRYLFRIIRILNKGYRNGKSIRAYWYCDNSMWSEELYKIGRDFRRLCDFEFKVLTKF